MIIKEIQVKTALSKSKVYNYTINPYIGCTHNCYYCYARFMKRFSGHKEPWGEFVDVKINVADILQNEVKKKRIGDVWISGICDPYQPTEEKYQLTRKCLEILLKCGWPVTIQTKSTLVLRDIELFKRFKKVRVGFSIATADEKTKQIFESKTDPIKERIVALAKLRKSGIETYAMIAPILPKTEGLGLLLRDKVDSVVIDRMNYHYADFVYKKYKLEYAMRDSFFNAVKEKLVNDFEKDGILCSAIF